MKFSVGCELGYQVDAPSSFVLNIQPTRLEQQRILRELLVLTPDLPVESHVAPESGNRLVRFQAPACDLTVRYDAEVDLEVQRQDPATVAEIPPAELPFEVLPHLNPSRYCQSDRLPRAAQADFGGLEPGHGRVTAVCNWIYKQVEYRRGTSDVHTSACDTLVDRAGVCRDFAHLGIALCRALGIPARFASCYAWRLDPPDFHAVFEAYLGGRWWLFDPTRQAALDGLVRIGVGRDASEVAFSTIYGAAWPNGITVRIEPVAAPGQSAGNTVLAVSTSGR
ncbi:MAG TPA: transglutaminase family protein [Geminicoccaceae bacterium]|nr:transglutaminase family protein [Geminicoccaceae bacterium]